MAPIAKMLMFAGCLIFCVGLLLMFTDKIPFLGKLPGDMSIKKENFQLYIPFATCIILSVVFSAIVLAISFLNKK